VYSGTSEIIAAGRNDGGIYSSSGIPCFVCAFIICSDSGSSSGHRKCDYDEEKGAWVKLNGVKYTIEEESDGKIHLQGPVYLVLK